MELISFDLEYIRIYKRNGITIHFNFTPTARTWPTIWIWLEGFYFNANVIIIDEVKRGRVGIGREIERRRCSNYCLINHNIVDTGMDSELSSVRFKIVDLEDDTTTIIIIIICWSCPNNQKWTYLSIFNYNVRRTRTGNKQNKGNMCSLLIYH